MSRESFVISYDIGTTGNKTCLYRLGEPLELAGSCQARYPLHVTPDGGAEQNADDWWGALRDTTRRILADTGTDPAAILGVSFCCQMQGFIPVDASGAALRNPMIYMDGRATRQFEKGACGGLLKIEGLNAFKALTSLYLTGGMAATAKDPLWKYHWLRENEPEIFAKMDKWLDVKDYLNMRCTGRATMTPDSANITFMYDTRPGRLGWSATLCRMFGVDMRHLPEVVQATGRVGDLTAEAASHLGLKEGTPVFGGGGDASCIPLGAGCTELHDTHIYIGTSGWVVANVDKRMVDVGCLIASILGPIHGRYNYIAEQDTSGVCLQWFKDHLALDEIGVYLKDRESGAAGEDDRHLYELLNRTVEETEPGAGGVIFTPWLHGNRAPKQDPFSRAMFFNIGMNTGKRAMLRTVLEGVAFHKRWMLEAVEKRVPRRETLRFVGGGAKSEAWCRIMADVTGRRIEAIENPQDAGAMGAALISAVGLDFISGFEGAKAFIPVRSVYQPRSEHRETYDRLYAVFKQLYGNNRKLFRALNREGGE